VELDALSELHFQGERVDWCQRLREFEHQFVGLFGLHWRACQVAEDEAIGDDLAQIGVGGRVPIAGKRLRTEKAQCLAFGCESGVHQKIRIDPPETKRRGAGKPTQHHVSAVDHIISPR
jgi:hypothetical protein